MKKLLVLTAIAGMCATSAFANESNDNHAKAMAQYMFKKIDTNGDGFISKEEHAAFAQKMFDEADTNHDGKLSLEEVTAQKVKEMDMMKKDMGWDKPSVNEDSKTNMDKGKM